jgi:hypothetical protein
MASVTVLVNQNKPDVRCGEQFEVSGTVKADHDTTATVCASLAPGDACRILGGGAENKQCEAPIALTAHTPSPWAIRLAVECQPAGEIYFRTLGVSAGTASACSDDGLVSLTVRC